MEIQDSEDDAEPVEVLQSRKRRQVCLHRQLGSDQPLFCCHYAISAVLVSAEAEIYVPAHSPHTG